MIAPGAYFSQLADALQTVDPVVLAAATAILDDLYRRDGTLFAAGNGQSASTVDAFALDMSKQTAGNRNVRRFRTVSLASSISALTAWANDTSYADVFLEQLKTHFRAGDVLVAVSASGNSPNIVRAAEWVREQGSAVIALTGFTGGKLRPVATACVHVDVADYGHAETAHIAIMHYWVDYFKEIVV